MVNKIPFRSFLNFLRNYLFRIKLSFSDENNHILALNFDCLLYLNTEFLFQKRSIESKNCHDNPAPFKKEWSIMAFVCRVDEQQNSSTKKKIRVYVWKAYHEMPRSLALIIYPDAFT